MSANDLKAQGWKLVCDVMLDRSAEVANKQFGID